MEKIKLRHSGWWNIYQNHVRRVVLHDTEQDSKKVSYWRNETFCSILTYITPLSVIALIPGVFMSFSDNIAVVGFVDLFAFFSIVIITGVPGITLKARKLLFIFVFYCLSFILLYCLPLPGAGLLFLLTNTVFSSLIYSSSAAYYSACVNTGICIYFAISIHFGINIPIVANYNFGEWIAISSNLVLLSFASTKYLDVLLTGLTISLKHNTIAENKLEKANRLYHFLSQINQSIVHLKDERTLFQKSCDIAFTIGKFKMAWIGMFNHDNRTIALINQNGIPEKGIPLFSAVYENKCPQGYILSTGSYYVCNNIENELTLERWIPFAKLNGIKSFIILPIKKEGIIIGSFNIYAGDINFFDETEIDLLVEATRDISFALDVFEKEKRHALSEELIIKNENRFRSLIEKSKDIKMLTNINGEFTYGSPSVTKLFGYSTEELLNESAFTFFHPEDLPDLLSKRNAIIGVTGGSFSFQSRLRHKNGQWIWCEGTITNMLHEPGIRAFVSNFRDITERKRAEQELVTISENLQKTLSDLQKIMDSSMDIICSMDENGRFVNVSKATNDILGYQPDELVGKKHIDMVWHEDVEKTNQAAVQIISGIPTTFFENRYMHKDGNIVNILWSAKWDNDTKLMYCIAKDITERKKAEDQKEKLSSDLIQRSKDLEQFSYIVSHNLRAPIANLLGFAELLRFDSSRDVIMTSMNGMSIAAQKLDEVMKDLNEILQIRTIVSENKEEVYFQNLIEDISLSIDNIIKKENVTIRTDFKSIGKMLSVKSYLYSIFYNLIINSIKFHKPGVSPIIEVKSQLTQKGVQIIFKDNGLGIDLKQHQKNLFGLYKRFHLHIEGKGMGLFMMKTQVETLGGEISVISELNKGAQFTIEFKSID